MAEMTKETKCKKMNDIAGKAIKELERIAFNEEEPIKIRMDILKWFAEFSLGKPKNLTATEEKEDKSYEISIKVEE